MKFLPLKEPWRKWRKWCECVYIESTSSKENQKQQNKPTLNTLSLCDTSISKSRSFLKGVLDEWSASSQSTDWATSVWSMSMSVSMSCLRGTPGLKIWQHLFYTAVFWLGIISRPHAYNSWVGNKINWTLCQRHFLWCCLTINNFPHLCHSKLQQMLKGIYKYVAITKAVTVSICWPRRLKRKSKWEGLYSQSQNCCQPDGALTSFNVN